MTHPDAPSQHEAPPAGEELHLPGPSLIPLLNAVGVAIALIGLTAGLFFTVVGTILFLVTTVMWVRDTARDISELPLDHSSH